MIEGGVESSVHAAMLLLIAISNAMHNGNKLLQCFQPSHFCYTFYSNYGRFAWFMTPYSADLLHGTITPNTACTFDVRHLLQLKTHSSLE